MPEQNEIKEVLNLKYWTVVRDAHNILWLTLDKLGTSTNILDQEILENLHTLLINLESQGSPPRGLVIQSGKPNAFIAGADIKQFSDPSNPEADAEEKAMNFIRQGQLVFERLAALPFPTVALIQGYCLGGGLELSLACKYRVAEDIPQTVLGLPEVKLGIHPGWGGSVRLPRLIGGLKAMDLILSGKTVSAKKAAKMGIVDMALPKRELIPAVLYFIEKMPTPRKAKGLDFLTNRDLIRPTLGKFLHRKLIQKVNPNHYPAPFTALENWVKEGVASDHAFFIEAQSISQLINSDTARNLLRVFLLQEKLKSQNKDASFQPQHVHVIGAGAMGGDIAAVAALKGFKVTLQDSNKQAIAGALSRAKIFFEKQLKETYLVQAAQDRLMPDSGYGIKHADVIIEAVIEKKEVKQQLFKQIEAEAKSEALLATNTSTIPLEVVSELMQNPARLIGLHFFNPATKMPLVEVVHQDHPDLSFRQHGIAFSRKLDKLPLLVRSAPGFLVNRLLMPYLLEAVLLFDEGVAPEVIDQAALDFGMPVGPIELADTVGLDICLFSAETLISLGVKGVEIPASIRDKVAKGNLGKKTGQGFYQYHHGKKLKTPTAPHYRIPEDLIDRLILRMANEAFACLDQKIVADKDAIDAGMIFGTGFAPFRGGLMHYVIEQGPALLLQRLTLLCQRYGDRFTPDAGWMALIANDHKN